MGAIVAHGSWEASVRTGQKKISLTLFLRLVSQSPDGEAVPRLSQPAWGGQVKLAKPTPSPPSPCISPN